MDYQEFLDKLYQRYSGNVKLGLQRMFEILKEMDSPNLKMKGFHIAGTNGKGSTCAMLEALSLGNNLTTGLNTSPHLVNYTERFRINGKNITFEEIYNYYKEWEITFLKTEASFFEITTAIAFKLFFDKKVDTAIFEVGLGGRLDGTNPFIPTVSAITSISIDHKKSLGDNIPQIAFEKAGIIKKDIPVVLGKLTDEALEVIIKIADERGTTAYCYQEDYFVENIRLNDNGTLFDYRLPSEDITMKDVSVNLLGEHQAFNCGVALTSFILYLKLTKQEINLERIKESLNQVNWSGRMQIISRDPVTIIDGAHNDAGMEFLIKNMKAIFPKRRISFVLGILRDKPFREMLTMTSEIAH
ncbi:MAG: hypothetical protein B6226_04110, partial [Candidatus Cloacimonetes bacterium 4572_65]